MTIETAIKQAMAAEITRKYIAPYQTPIIIDRKK